MANTPKKSSKPRKASSRASVQLSFKLDKKKIAAIQRCLQKGRLTITVANVGAVGKGRGLNGYIYD